MASGIDIDSFMIRFAALPDARVGAGPRHPTNPDPALEERVARLFAEVPALTRDQGFVDFMWRYAGASRGNPNGSDVFEIFGFSAAASTYDEFEEPLIGDDGSFMFAEAIHEKPGEPLDVYTVGFAFNVDPGRQWAVYRAVQEKGAVNRPFTRHLGSFAEFLAEAVAAGGRHPQTPAT